MTLNARVLSCVTFDLDDTLYLEREYVYSGFRAVGAWAHENLGVPDFCERAWAAFERGTRHSVFNAVLAEHGITATKEMIDILIDTYRTHAPDIHTLPDASLCVAELHERVPLALISDGPIRSQRAKAGCLGVSSWTNIQIFTAALGAEFSKPHPRAFAIVESSAHVPGAQCVYVADNPAKDFIAPRSRGWATVRVRRTQSLHESVESDDDVDVEIPDLSTLTIALEGIGLSLPKATGTRRASCPRRTA